LINSLELFTALTQCYCNGSTRAHGYCHFRVPAFLAKISVYKRLFLVYNKYIIGQQMANNFLKLFKSESNIRIQNTKD
jgi:hypothetical protein